MVGGSELLTFRTTGSVVFPGLDAVSIASVSDGVVGTPTDPTFPTVDFVLRFIPWCGGFQVTQSSSHASPAGATIHLIDIMECSAARPFNLIYVILEEAELSYMRGVQRFVRGNKCVCAHVIRMSGDTVMLFDCRCAEGRRCGQRCACAPSVRIVDGLLVLVTGRREVAERA